ncbi:MAG: hypothetical protein ACTSW1_11885 [Candidatus Hodarchaeales archaeon]
MTHPINRDELRKILPKLIKEDDAIRGAIIAALEGVIATKDDIKLIIQEMDRRFEAVDRRFEQLILELKGIKTAVGTLGNKSGINLEKTILEIMRETLIKEKVDINKISAKKIKDWDAEVFQRGSPVQLDIIAENGDRIFVEIKFHCTVDDLLLFDKKCEFFAKKMGEPTKRIIIALEIDDDAKEIAEDYGIKVITKGHNSVFP